MVSKTRQSLWLAGAALCCLVVIGLTSAGRPAIAKNDDVDDQKLKQKMAQAATEEMVHRIGTMLQVLEYYQPDKATQNKTLERVATTLSTLSREQMEEVLRRLDKAAAEADPNKSAEDLKIAHNKHIEIMQTLRSLMVEYELLNTLDLVAEKLDKLSKTELELALRSGKLTKDQEDAPFMDILRPGGFGGKKGGKGGQVSPAQLRNQNMKQLATEQNNLKDDLTKLLEKAGDLTGKLPGEQRELIETLNKAVKEYHVTDTLNKANEKLDGIEYAFSSDQTDRLKEANALQRKAADDMKDLASMLRKPADQLAALRKAQEQIDETLRQQAELQEKSKVQADKNLKNPPTPLDQLNNLIPDFPKKGGKKGGPFGVNNTPMPDDRGAKEMSDQQARLALDTRDTSNLLKDFAKELSDKIDTARLPMKASENALRDGTPEKSVPPQDKAIQLLKDAKAEIADLIAKTENKNNDPLAALKAVAESVEKLLKEQIDTRDQTQKAGDAKQDSKLPQIAPQQKDLANRTENLNAKALPTKDTQKALNQAAKSMDNAAKNLQNQKAPDAVAKQNDAIKSLEDAKKNLQQQIAEIEKRRDDIAKLDEASKKLDELTRNEGKIADAAKEKSNTPQANTKDLAKKQGELTPQAKDLAKKIDKAAPKAADLVNKGAQNMDAAKKELEKNQAKQGNQEAKQAVDRLKEAQKELANKLEQLKAKELADQAAMKKNDLAEAQKQLQKAIEQTQQAMKDAQKAEEQKLQKNLAEQQKNLADLAKKLNMDKAADPAQQAAKMLQKGDLAKALDQQKKALENFQQAAKQKTEKQPGDPKDKGDGKKGDKGDGKKGDKGDGKKGDKGDAKKGDKGDGKKGDKGDGKGQKGDKGQQTPAQQAKAKQGEPKQGQGQGKQGDPKQADPNAAQMAKQQQALMDAVRDLQAQQAGQAQQAQNSNQGAMQALGQAMAGSPQGAQQQMQQAANNLGKAGQELKQGSPGQAKQNQQKALDNMQKAMQQMKGAQTAQNKGDPKAKGDPKTAKGDPKDGKGKDGKGDPKQAKGDPKDGKDGKGKGKGDPKDGKGLQAKGQKQGDPKGQKQGDPKGTAQEKNDNKGKGDRVADGKVNNGQSQLNDIIGSDTFLQLPPRQRELIRQALAGDLPPDYAAQIQQYYLNISKGKAGGVPPPPPK